MWVQRNVDVLQPYLSFWPGILCKLVPYTYNLYLSIQTQRIETKQRCLHLCFYLCFGNMVSIQMWLNEIRFEKKITESILVDSVYRLRCPSVCLCLCLCAICPTPITPKRRGMETSGQRGYSLKS